MSKNVETISYLLPKGKRRTAVAQERLRAAYQAVFSGHGSKEDADIVLVDMARVSGYYHTLTPVETDTNTLWYREGQRALFGRAMKFLNLPREALDAIAAAVMLEDKASTEEGNEL